ncbi:hypothetical protein BST20_05055 [Mycobacterium branderi]|nr:hypothetical protein BST20_05055 [Mycobacterium branderi]
MRAAADAISTFLEVPVSMLDDGRPYLLVGDRSQVTMYADDDSPGQWFAEVYHAGEVADRQALSRSIYDYLVEHTNWDLTLDSDDANDTIASRIKSHTK